MYDEEKTMANTLVSAQLASPEKRDAPVITACSQLEKAHAVLFDELINLSGALELILTPSDNDKATDSSSPQPPCSELTFILGREVESAQHMATFVRNLRNRVEL